MTATDVRIRLLGPVGVGGDDAALGAGKPRQALTVLAARAGEMVPTDTIVDVLWPEDPPTDPQRSLQVHLSKLRRVLEEAGLDAAIVHEGTGYVLRVAPETVDLRRFESLVDEGVVLGDADPARARDVLGRALELWRGRPFGELGDHPALRGEVVRLEDLRLRATEARIDAELVTGRHEEVVGELRRLTDEHPLRERLWGQLMVAVYRSGRQGEALEAYERARRILAEELGVDPSPALRTLHQRMLRQDPGLDPALAKGPTGGPGPAGDQRPDTRAVAVLPFDVIGGADDARFLASGLHNDLLTELSKVPELTVISRTSVLAYREADAPMTTIARELNAGTVVEGTVQSAGRRFRLTVQLIDGREDVHRWAESYDRELTTEDLFALQSELARDIAASLSAELVPVGARRSRSGPPTASLEAYQLTAQGRQQLYTKTRTGMFRAVELFDRAVALDPDYAEAWVGLADSLGLLESYNYAERDDVIPRAQEAVDRALALDPDSAGAHTSRGLLRCLFQDGPGALGEFEHAIRLQPSYDEAHNWHSWISLIVGRGEDALERSRRAAELNPLSAEPVSNLALSHLAVGRPEDALAAARRADELSPFSSADYYLALALYDLGRFDEAVEALMPLRTGPDGVLKVAWSLRGPDVTLALAHVRRGDADAAREVLASIDASENPFAVGLVRLGLGEVEAASRQLAAVEHMSAWPALAVHHHYRDVWEPILGTDLHDHLVRTALRSWNVTDHEPA